LLEAVSGPTPAAAAPPCDQAIEAYDAAFSNRSDDQALAASRALEEACAKPPSDLARAFSRRAVVSFLRGDLDTATTPFEEAVRLDPQNPTLHMSLCGVYTEARRFKEAIATCEAGLKVAKAQDDGSPKRHAKVLEVGFNLALAKVRRGGYLCDDRSVFGMFDAYREANPQHAWVHQLVGAWVWDCEKDFERGFALYKKSCSLGQAAACEQVAFTESCRCQTRKGALP
jgi:tetratricopeptide (TPR) repeat protein